MKRFINLYRKKKEHYLNARYFQLYFVKKEKSEKIGIHAFFLYSVVKIKCFNFSSKLIKNN